MGITMQSIKWRYHQILPTGRDGTANRWVSPDVQGVMAGHLGGQPRAAVEEGTGLVVYALDAKGQATAAAVALFAQPNK
jgi:hypothetical protein